MRDLIRLIANNSDNCDKKYMKIKFHWDNDLPLNRALILWMLNLIFIKGPNISQKFS